jgi:large subunit ribosomal protein L5
METLKAKNKTLPGYTNPMQTPKIMKVVVSSGVGSFKDKAKFKIVEDRLARITGQKASQRGAKVSIATFKSREGDIVGYQVTLRGQRMHDFLEKLIHIALPRTKDFRGINPTAADEMGNYTLGIKEHTIFPEAADEELKDVFGLANTIVTTAKSKEEVVALMTHLGFPFKK